MVKFVVCFGKMEKKEYKANVNGRVVTKQSISGTERKSYPVDVVISGVDCVKATNMFDKWIKSLPVQTPFHVYYDEETGVLSARVLYPKNFDSVETASKQRNDLITLLRHEASLVKKIA